MAPKPHHRRRLLPRKKRNSYRCWWFAAALSDPRMVWLRNRACNGSSLWSVACWNFHMSFPSNAFWLQCVNPHVLVKGPQFHLLPDAGSRQKVRKKDTFLHIKMMWIRETPPFFCMASQTWFKLMGAMGDHAFDMELATAVGCLSSNCRGPLELQQVSSINENIVLKPVQKILLAKWGKKRKPNRLLPASKPCSHCLKQPGKIIGDGSTLWTFGSVRCGSRVQGEMVFEKIYIIYIYPSFWHRIHFRDTSSLSQQFSKTSMYFSSKCGAVSPGNLGWQCSWQSIWKVWYHFPSHTNCLCNSGGALLLAWTTTACLVNGFITYNNSTQKTPNIPTIPSIVYGDFEPQQDGCASS